MDQLFSADETGKFASFYLAKNRGSNIIYIVVIIALATAFTALPFINVDVTFQSRGTIRSITENNAVVSNIGGQVEFVKIKANQQVNKGDILLALDNSGLAEQIDLNQTKLSEIATIIEDLNNLINGDGIENLQLAVYIKAKQEYEQKLRGLNKKRRHFLQELNTSKTLYEKNVISKSEYLQYEYNYNNVVTDLDNFKSQEIANWQSELQNYTQTELELKSKIQQLIDEDKRYIIRAPITGVINNYSGIKPGNFIVPNQPLLEISPNNDLIVECYVSPRDIGYLSLETPVKFQIDAYNYNQWGLAEGRVLEIFNDVSLINDLPVFRVRCELLTKEMKLKSGTSGKIKKGMTLTGRFTITQRTLWQLLYDNMDDWLNPAQNI